MALEKIKGRFISGLKTQDSKQHWVEAFLLLQVQGLCLNWWYQDALTDVLLFRNEPTRATAPLELEDAGVEDTIDQYEVEASEGMGNRTQRTTDAGCAMLCKPLYLQLLCVFGFADWFQSANVQLYVTTLLVSNRVGQYCTGLWSSLGLSKAKELIYCCCCCCSYDCMNYTWK